MSSERWQALEAGGCVFRSCHDTRLTEEDVEQARLELGESEGGRRAALHDLRSRLIGDGEFRYRLDDAYLLRFLRYQKFDAGKAHASLRSFYALRSEMPRLFALPDRLESFLRSGLVKCLPYRTEQGSIVFWIDTHGWRVSEMSFWDTLVLAHAFADVVSQNPSCQVNGVVGLWDLGGLTAAHLAEAASFGTLRVFARCMQVTLLGSEWGELHAYLSPRILPEAYGGDIACSRCDISRAVLDNLPYIEYERSFGPRQPS